jgi:hypothetical protein
MAANLRGAGKQKSDFIFLKMWAAEWHKRTDSQAAGAHIQI